MKMVIKNNPDVREKALEHGMSYPYDEELIMLILGSGNKEMSVDVMARKIRDVLDESNSEEVVQNLMAVKGIGAGKALAVAAALELGKRRNGHLKKKISCPSDIVPFVRNYAVSNKEHFLMITLDGGYKIIQIHVVSVGTLNRSLIHPREIFSEAIKDNATALILCHNHPSGECMPSNDDIAATRNLLEASVIMGIDILDHIIVACDNYYSFVENDLLFSSS
ncbi:MAG: DNA repair protein RadC [Treponema sp.]|nr:DNA repair protein RadC [Treponema sp.]